LVDELLDLVQIEAAAAAGDIEGARLQRDVIAVHEAPVGAVWI
jgi:hypothetical protein